MRKSIAVLIFVIFSFLSCSNDEEYQNIPECLKPIIDVIIVEPVQNPRANIEKWNYEGQEVYLVNGQNFPDGQSHVITLNCEDICTLGGFDGPLNDCVNWEAADYIETIWTDKR